MEGPRVAVWTRRHLGVMAGGLAGAFLGLRERQDTAGRKHKKHRHKHPKHPCDKQQEGQSCSTDDQCCSGQCTNNQCE
jgi:hypothetical protein